MRLTENIHREKSHTPTSIKLFNIRLKPVLGTFIKTIYIVLPVLFSSCDKAEDKTCTESHIPLTICFPDCTKAGTCTRLDIFSFDDDRLQNLDSYQRSENPADDRIGIRSQSGNKIIFVCANSGRDIYAWTEINSFKALDNIEMKLEDERRGNLIMTGIGYAEAGQPGSCNIEISPLASEICLRSLACDFSSAGQEKQLKDIRIYLTNVSARCSLTSDDIYRPIEIMNHGKLDEDALNGMKEPDILLQEIHTPVGKNPHMADVRLLCYPNCCTSEGPGTPFTRLVIEGQIDGRTYWWPININRGKGIKDPGIHRNCRYVYDIILKRKGNTDPDMAVETEQTDINLEIKQWKEKDNYSVSF